MKVTPLPSSPLQQTRLVFALLRTIAGEADAPWSAGALRQTAGHGFPIGPSHRLARGLEAGTDSGLFSLVHPRLGRLTSRVNWRRHRSAVWPVIGTAAVDRVG